MVRTRIILLVSGILILPFVTILIVLKLLYPTLHSECRRSDLGPDFRQQSVGTIDLFTNVPGEDVRSVAWLLDNFYEAFFETFGENFSLQKMDRNVEFWVFKTVEELQAHFKKKHKRDLFNSGGYYDPARGVIAIPWAGRTDELIESVLHEGTHLVFDRYSGTVSPQWSYWLSEGLACYFGSSRFDGMKLLLGGYDPWFLEVLKAYRKAGKRIPLKKLLEATYEPFLGEENVLWYAASQLLVYYLLHGEGGSLRRPFFAYYKIERRAGKCGMLEFISVFGDDLVRFDRQWWDFLEKLER